MKMSKIFLSIFGGVIIIIIFSAILFVSNGLNKKNPLAAIFRGRCTPNWFCAEWSKCVNSKRNRNCFDTEKCNTFIGKPVEVQVCKDGQECRRNKFSMVFILAENSNNLSEKNQISKVNILKQKTSETFSWATRGLATLDTSYRVSVIKLNKDSPTVEEIVKEFYKNNSDNFDFITIFTSYDIVGNQYHISTKNNIKGIGLSVFNNDASYGSNGKLLGINWMKNIDNYNAKGEDLTLSVNAILHETSHQWGVYVSFINDLGSDSSVLKNPYNMVHWDKKVETGYDLLNGFSWKINGDGTFTAKERVDKKNGYSDIDLYLMGLIPENKVGAIKLITSDFDTKDIQPGTTINGVMKNISVNQIINAEGGWECAPS